MEVTPTDVLLADVVFVRLSVKNPGRRPVLAPRACYLETGTLHLDLLDSEEQTIFEFPPDGCPCGGELDMAALEPGHSRDIVLMMVRLPRLDQVKFRFWNPALFKSGTYVLRARCNGLQEASTAIRVQPRPQAEMAAILKHFEDGAREPMPKDWPTFRPSLSMFYLWPFPWKANRPENLSSLEELLSPGSLRDIVRLTRLAQAVYDAKELGDRREATTELLEWLDRRSEIERHWMAMNLHTLATSAWGRQFGEYYFEFVEQIIPRLPEDYRGKRLQGQARAKNDLARRAYHEYLQRERQEPEKAE